MKFGFHFGKSRKVEVQGYPAWMIVIVIFLLCTTFVLVTKL